MDHSILMKPRERTAFLLSVAFTLILALGISCSVKRNQLKVSNKKSLVDLLTKLKQEYNQPAIAAALVQGDRIVAEAAVGTMIYGENKMVNENSRFHLGSTTKSMTAVLVAMLVKEGMLSYATTLKQALPGMEMRDEYRSATIADLLNNKAGIIAFQLTTLEDPAIVEKLRKEIPDAYPDPTEQRREVTKLALSLEPIAQPGTKVIYSNVGWPIIGYILELASGQSYEDLLKKRIFEPMGMKTARIGGWPASASEPDQPRGHYPPQDTTGTPEPQELEDQYILSAWMNPSGGVHCSIHDFALYAREHLLGLQGKGKLLDQESYRIIHSIQVTTNLREMYPHMKQDREASFGYGWAINKEDRGNVSSAAGSGGTFFAQIQVDPANDRAFVGFTNCGNGGKALSDLFKQVAGEK
jgi:CubicO group peptidase (beta-lactamase class C family)